MQRRAIILVLDSFGIGATADAAQFGDAGADTLGHIAGACANGRADKLGVRAGAYAQVIAELPIVEIVPACAAGLCVCRRLVVRVACARQVVKPPSKTGISVGREYFCAGTALIQHPLYSVSFFYV